jgi:hypothetical protein
MLGRLGFSNIGGSVDGPGPGPCKMAKYKRKRNGAAKALAASSKISREELERFQRCSRNVRIINCSSEKPTFGDARCATDSKGLRHALTDPASASAEEMNRACSLGSLISFRPRSIVMRILSTGGHAMRVTSGRNLELRTCRTPARRHFRDGCCHSRKRLSALGLTIQT